VSRKAKLMSAMIDKIERIRNAIRERLTPEEYEDMLDIFRDYDTSAWFERALRGEPKETWMRSRHE
jgi:hypothetical protein